MHMIMQLLKVLMYKLHSKLQPLNFSEAELLYFIISVFVGQTTLMVLFLATIRPDNRTTILFSENFQGFQTFIPLYTRIKNSVEDCYEVA